ncbi:MAG: PCI domain-containing protein [Myxococcales bacterium]|nr:PCI domain-containing protein [Myxococcales bacterium]MCB9569185.1 PCI domain-containing protein [Myxococcales bacterium]MCB9706054.1 PCI domain-containing protein [Myxococcales bacterium]
MKKSLGVKLVLGGILSFVGVSCSAIGLGMMAAPSKPEDPSSGLAVLIMALGVFGVPGLVLLLLGLRTRRSQHLLDQVVAMGQASSRLPLQQLSSQLGVPIPRVRELVLQAIAAGRLAGRMDFEQGVFVSASTTTGVRQLSLTCPSCGGVSEVIVSPSEPSLCRFCGQRVA